jgi:hypothetical protein
MAEMVRKLSFLLVGVALAGLVATAASGPVVAASRPPTPYPTLTPQATYTPYPSPTAVHTPTAVPSATPIPQGVDPKDSHKYCVFGQCVDFSGVLGAIGNALSGAVVGLFSPIEHAFSDAFATLVQPFQRDLTYTPDIPQEASWGGLRNVQGALQELAGVLFIGFLTVGVFARYLESIGAGDFQQLTSPVRRAVVVTGFIGGYPQLMGWGFTMVNGAAATINGIPLSVNETAWEAVRGAMFTVQTAFSIQGVLDVLLMVLAYVLVLLSVVVRDFGLGALGALYIVGPLAMACYVSPYVEVIARSWVKMVLSLSLWPIGYAIILKVIALMFAGGGPLSEFGGFSAALGALGLVLLLYKTPALVGSFVGSSATVLGAVASTLTDAGLGAVVGSAKSTVFNKIPFMGK